MQHWFREEKDGSHILYTDISQFPEFIYGFVYIIKNKIDGKFYVGKKILRNNLSKKLTKKEIAAWDKPGKVPKKKKEVKESNWKEYWGSNKDLVDDLKKLGEENFERQILQFCRSSKQLTYFETLWQLHFDVLCVECYNANILGKFFRRDVLDACQESRELIGRAKISS
jgi:hypothetical protein